MYDDEHAEEITRLVCINREFYVLAILTSNPDAPGLVNSLLDALTEKGGLDVLARTAMSCGPEVAGDMLIKLIYGTFEAVAERVAEQEVAAMVLARALALEHCKPKTAAQVELLETL